AARSGLGSARSIAPKKILKLPIAARRAFAVAHEAWLHRRLCRWPPPVQLFLADRSFLARSLAEPADSPRYGRPPFDSRGSQTSLCHFARSSRLAALPS